MSVRTFPALGYFGKAVCRWCEGEILHEDGPKAGQPNPRRCWHKSCYPKYLLHTHAPTQFAYLVERDGKICATCGSLGLRWSRVSIAPYLEDGYPYTWVVCRPELEVEHTIPLWMVSHLPPNERRRYFGPENLTLMCVADHKKKTKREAAERAHGNRLIARDNGTRRARKAIPSRSDWPKGRKVQSRGFAK